MLSAFELAPSILAWVAVLTFAAAFVQGTLGFGYAIVTVPLMALVDSRLAPAVQLIQMIPLIFAIYWRERSHADWTGVFWTTLGRFPGTYLGMLLLAVASQRSLDLIIGSMVLVAVFSLRGERAIRRTKAIELIAGVCSGGAAVVSAIGGPPIALLYKDSKGAEARATLSAIFGVGLFVTIAGRAWAGKLTALDLSLGVWTMPLVMLGFVASKHATRWIEGPRLRFGILLLCTLAALALIGKAVV